MKQRTSDYMARKKEQSKLRHPDDYDLRSFLIAEYNSTRSIIVKKDIMKMLDNMKEPEPEHAPQAGS